MNLKICINKIKNIKFCEFILPIEKGIYCLAGINGCGKSTVLSCLAQSVFISSLKKLNDFDYESDSCVLFEYGDQKTKWKNVGGKWAPLNATQTPIRFNGMYEGSLFYGTRFEDSLIIDKLVYEKKVATDDIVEADDYMKKKMSFILHGDLNHYRTLKRIRNKKIANRVGLRNMPYFQEINGNLISQYKMSSGECLLVSLLHFIYNSVIRRSLPGDSPILMLVDEIELALHPIAISRLIDLLNDIIKEHENLTVLLTSHSAEVIRKISPNNLLMMEGDKDSKIDFYSPCYPSYAIRDIYMHAGFDYVILVEDLLTKYVVDKVIQQGLLSKAKLINILPVGGWENVLKFQMRAYNTNTFGVGTTVFSVLDGDIEEECQRKTEYKKLQRMYLPINSIEKYLYKICTDTAHKKIKREINDAFFHVDSMESIRSECIQERDNIDNISEKTLYRKILRNLEKRDISEDAFIKGLCDIIVRYEDFTQFSAELKSRLG